MISLTWWERFVLKVFRQGQIPKHIAFIMDGNRRYAKKTGSAALTGHESGADAMKRCILYSLQLGVQMATFFAFSLQNFNRSKDEVDFLMSLALKEFSELQKMDQEGTLLNIITKNKIRIVVVGDKDGQLARDYPKLRESIAEIEERTKENDRMTLNMCFAYDSLYEVAQAVRKGEGVFENLLIPHEVDILVRTSNEHRLSNFMLMQCRYALIEIEKVLWPHFDLKAMMRLLLKYNYHYAEIEANRLETK